MKKIIDDLKGDVKVLKELGSGNYKSKYSKKEILSMKGVFSEYWIIFVLIIAAFGAGFFFQSVLENNNCIELIEEQILPNCPEFYDSPASDLFNISMKDVEVNKDG